MYNKSEICKTANELVKKGYTKSAAFVEVWAVAKNPSPTKEGANANDIATKAREFKEIQRMIEELEAKANLIKDSIIHDMDGAEEVSADIFKIRYITVVSNRLDTVKFKTEHNELYSEYLKESATKRFTVVA